MGNILARSTSLFDDFHGVLDMLLDKVANDITRLAVLSALTVAGNASVDVTHVSTRLCDELCGFMKHADRGLVESSLECALAIVSALPGEALGNATKQLICDADLHIAGLALRLSSRLPFNASVLDASLSIARSPLLGGSALVSLCDYVASVMAINPHGFKSVEEKLLVADIDDVTVVSNMGRILGCAAASAAANGERNVSDTYCEAVPTLEGSEQSLVLYALGEMEVGGASGKS